ncbi:hypothetical protein GCM10022252_02700 [Streptosporangium oxazolinicum]|uniref:Uncharacterized protein n=1 Tax=Streptosporangium oxazolinicum TaxID=909287 RepID=A0ABP8A9F0_9ACTN
MAFVPGLTPSSPVTTVAPVSATVVPASTAKFVAVPSGTGVASFVPGVGFVVFVVFTAFVSYAALAGCGIAATQPSATATVRAPVSQERTVLR